MCWCMRLMCNILQVLPRATGVLLRGCVAGYAVHEPPGTGVDRVAAIFLCVSSWGHIPKMLENGHCMRDVIDVMGVYQ